MIDKFSPVFYNRGMDKKVTMQDVAEAAGVSKSTVSFILNGRDDLRISEQTKKKVWQVINMLNYRPNLYAKNLRGTQMNKVIAFFMGHGLSDLEKLSFYEFFDTAANILLESGQRAQLLLDIARLDNVDAIIARDLPRPDFTALAECNFIPLIAADCLVSDPIFYEVSLDYPALKAMAEAALPAGFTYVCTQPRDRLLQAQLLSVFPGAKFVRTPADLAALDAGPVLVTQPFLQRLLSTDTREVFYPEGLLQRQIQQLLRCVSLAVGHESREQHSFTVL